MNTVLKYLPAPPITFCKAIESANKLMALYIWYLSVSMFNHQMKHQRIDIRLGTEDQNHMLNEVIGICPRGHYADELDLIGLRRSSTSPARMAIPLRALNKPLLCDCGEQATPYKDSVRKDAAEFAV